MTTAVKSKAKKPAKKDKLIKEIVTKVEKTQESPWYVFCSTGCGFCKKAEPVVEELNKEGHDILTLDLSEPDNAKLNQELKTEYGVQCGTPWFINAETGKGICGYREKDVIKKWLDGEDIPEPPRPKGMPPRPPFMGASDTEVKEWKKNYNKWLDDNQHLPETQRKSTEEVLSQPRPKSELPRPPMGPDVTEKAIDEWGKEYSKWSKENSHLPNLQPVDAMVKNIKNRIKQMANNPNAQAQPQPQAPSPNVAELEKRITELENKLNSVVNQADVVGGDLTKWEEDMEYKLDMLIEHLGVKI
jgi:thiol-disulfide isomerase/thioredoxin